MHEELKMLAAKSRSISQRSIEDYTDEELEFLKAVDSYKVTYRRPNPTCREILALLKHLGYVKRSKTDE